MSAVTGTSVTFFGVPILPPAATGPRVFRINNVLVDATALAGDPVQGIPVQASISISGGISLSLWPTRVRLSASYRVASPPPPRPPPNWPSAPARLATSVNLLQFSENFGTAFKTRVAAQTNNGLCGPGRHPPVSPSTWPSHAWRYL